MQSVDFPSTKPHTCIEAYTLLTLAISSTTAMEGSYLKMYPLPPIELYYVCLALDLDYKDMVSISAQTGISVEAFENMLLGEPVTREVAEKVLDILTHEYCCGYELTLKNVEIPLIPLSGGKETTKP